MIVLIHAHPHPRHSVAGRALLAAVADLPGLTVRSLYDLYPDFDIDIAAERAALTAARLVVWQHPVYWYSVPGLMKQWFDTVLGEGWAYGPGGDALRGKDCLWAPTTGAPFEDYAADGRHGHTLAEFELPLRRTAIFCGMHWLAPQVLHHAHQLDAAALAAAGVALRQRLATWSAQHER